MRIFGWIYILGMSSLFLAVAIKGIEEIRSQIGFRRTPNNHLKKLRSKEGKK